MTTDRLNIYFKSFDDNRLRAYQNYYQQGFSKESVRFVPLSEPKLIKSKFWNPLFSRRRIFRQFSEAVPPFAGQYILEVPGNKTVTRFAIDPHDRRDVFSRKVLDWSDIYFKSNMWPAESYPEKVHPLVNGNGALSPEGIAHLKTLRNAPKTVDVVFISRVWGNREHNMRLFEQLAKTDGNHVLHAIFTPEERKLDATAGYIQRLEKAGVRYGFETIARSELWDTLSRARIVVVRAGKHLCIPWRMIDLLAMGSCIALDSVPHPRWPVPLVDGQHYLSLGIERPVSGAPGKQQEYRDIPARIGQLMADHEMQAHIRQASAAYFERYAAPEKVVDYIIEKTLEHGHLA